MGNHARNHIYNVVFAGYGGYSVSLMMKVVLNFMLSPPNMSMLTGRQLTYYFAKNDILFYVYADVLALNLSSCFVTSWDYLISF